MDPDANLKEQLELAKKLQDAGEMEFLPGKADELPNDAARLAELVLALDEWLRTVDGGKDGFLPRRWSVNPDNPSIVGAVRDELIKFRDECLGSKQPGYMDPDGAVILSHAIRWLSFKAEGKPYELFID
jgi:hypothetical protein